MSAGLVQVGWYCDHREEKKEPPYAGSHMSSHGNWRKKKGWIDTFPEPNTTQALHLLDYHDAAKRPHCPQATPVHITAPAETTGGE